MIFWKLGCNWGSGKPDFYHLIKDRSIVICAEKRMVVGDYVAICRGYNVIAIATITEPPIPVTNIHSLKEEFARYKIEYDKWNNVAHAFYYELNDNEQFQYPLRQGICQINSHEIQNKIKAHIYKIKMLQTMTKYIKLLENNKNIVLTGAPGTGKTYLAQQIARKMITGKLNDDELSEEEREKYRNQCCFVQFHPSYDYTDFVEGLRAEELNGQVVFNLHNGIFKDFCKKAIPKNSTNNFDEIYQDFIDQLSESNEEFETPVKNKKFKLEINSRMSCNAIPMTEIGTKMTITRNMLYDYVVNNKIRSWKPYTTAIGNKLKTNFITNTGHNVIEDKSPFIFIIDEINRGEISKIFGELFFSIDPGYRGLKGKVITQYTNIQSEDTIFDETLGNGWFYVPDNIYIIGTMNDIDRSVESMDFAMRRRFSWIEVGAMDRIDMWNGYDWEGEAKKKMEAINKVIETIEGLSTSYHIGPAYFLKLDNYREESDKWAKLWDYHIHPLIKEYLRGNPDSTECEQKLKAAYDLTSNLND